MESFLLPGLLLVRLAVPAAQDPLPSWNDGPARKSILAFVEAVAREGGASYVPVPERVAVFDNDGTLWAEQPAYPQTFFCIARARLLAPHHPEWKETEPFKSALAGDLNQLLASGVQGLNALSAGVGAGFTPDDFQRQVGDWLPSAGNPRFGRSCTNCAYVPMLEVLRLLGANRFKLFVVSGGELEFLRPWTEQVYGIPPEQIIGTTVETKVEMRAGKPVLVRQAAIHTLNDGTNKVLSIQRVIGRRPIAAFGNSDGDLPMLEWTAAGAGLRLCVLVHHTDAGREWAYDRTAAVGRLDKGLEAAPARGWTLVDMEKDWRRVFQFDPARRN